MDVQMPEVDGIEATQKIRKMAHFATTPIIGVTAANVVGEKERCLQNGMSDFLTKPMRQIDLEQMIHKYLPFKPDIPEIIFEEHWNLETLDEQIDDDVEFKKIFLDIVHQEITNTYSQIQANQNFENKTDAKLLLHKLRGTARTAGLFKLGDLAFEAENKIILNEDPKEFYNQITKELAISLSLINRLIDPN